MKPFVPTVIALTLSVASLAAGAVQPPRPDLFGEPVSAPRPGASSSSTTIRSGST